MTATVQDILKKINYIEADVEIHKQILFSIPSAEKAAIERTIRLIADKKAEIEGLRLEIKAIAPAEYQRILDLEGAIGEFKALATSKGFVTIIGKTIDESCCLQLKDGNAIDCLVKACDRSGAWTIITLDGRLRHFASDLVDEAPPTNPPTSVPH